MHRRLIPGALALLVLIALPAVAQDQVMAVYVSGDYQFDYQQWPYGSYSGTFLAGGVILDPDVGWEPGQTESVGGRYELIADTLVAWAYGARLNVDDTVDLAALFIRTTDGSFAPGNYPIDLTNYMTEFAYLDDVTNFTFPEEGADMAAWLDSLEATHRFLGSSGSIDVTEVGENGFAGTFSGAMIDPDDFMIITISGGVFDLLGEPVTGVPVPSLLSVHGSFPNPFNPKTTLRLVLAEATPLRVSVLDVEGRRVKVLADLARAEGEVNLIWNGRDEAGRTQPAGVYFYRVETSRGTSGGKMVLLP